MEGWDGRANWNRDVLERIVALLFALANLAELAPGLPFLRRMHVLEILSLGEAEARAFVMGMAPVLADAPGEAGDAERLAASFRALALLLGALLARSRHSAFPGATGSRGCRPPRMLPGPAVHRPGARAPPAPDAPQAGAEGQPDRRRPSAMSPRLTGSPGCRNFYRPQGR